MLICICVYIIFQLFQNSILRMLHLITIKQPPVTIMKVIFNQVLKYIYEYILVNCRIFKVCCLAISFSLFFLILNILYSNPQFHAYYCCEFRKVTSAPEIMYSEPTNDRFSTKYREIVAIDDPSNSNDCILPPDVSDLDVTNDSAYESPSVIQSDIPPEPIASDREALTAVKMAVKFKQMKNFEKAKRLFQHAMVLSPNHHDVLLNYGEFLESNEDFINADHLYLKALMVRPKNSRALVNRERTLPVVKKIDLEELIKIDKIRALLISMDKKDPTLKRLKKEIYFQHIHHSVAIEGNTMSLAETRTIVETGLAVEGKSLLEHNEILGLDAALRYVNNTLASNNFITTTDILEIHRRVMGYVDPISAGTFRKSQVFVGEHRPPAASDVECLMEEFLQQLQPSHTTDMHPIHIAAFAHHKLVFIHPFSDGNGRTSRLLMNLIFMRYGYPPIIIRKEDRSQYFKYLQLAHEGDIRPFYRFICRATEYTIYAFLHAQEFRSPKIKSLESKYDITDIIPLNP